MRPRQGHRRAFALVGLVALLGGARAAHAHVVGLSNGRYVLAATTLAAELSMAERELLMWLPTLDTDHDGVLDPEELAANLPEISRAVVGGVAVSADGSTCPGTLDRASLLEGESGVLVQARYTCRRAPSRLALEWPILTSGGLAPNHRHVATIAAAGTTENVVFDRGHAAWWRELGGGSSRPGGLFWSMLRLGVEHILTGYDHLVFLLGLVVVGGRLRSLVGVVSAFTLAHSITLALSATGTLTPSPRFVEPAIALSIAYVGVENFFITDASRRWRVTFPFGLIHGFGFAGALREIALPRAQVPVALLSFNLGVEIGQLAVLAVTLPLVLAAGRVPAFGRRGVRVVSSTIAALGLILFVVRLTSAFPARAPSKKGAPDHITTRCGLPTELNHAGLPNSGRWPSEDEGVASGPRRPGLSGKHRPRSSRARRSPRPQSMTSTLV